MCPIVVSIDFSRCPLQHAVICVLYVSLTVAVGVLSHFLPFATPHFTPSRRLPGRVSALASRHHLGIIITALVP